MTMLWEQDFIYKGVIDQKISCHVGDYGRIASCNLIGDQPLFYSDNVEDDHVLEEDFLTGDFFASHMDDIQKKIQSYDTSIQALSNMDYATDDTRFKDILKAHKSETPHHTIDDILNFGQKSSIFQSYLGFIQSYKIDIQLSISVQSSTYNQDTNIIFVNPYLGQAEASVSLLRSMRIVWATKQGIMINPLVFQPDEAILAHRLFAADLDVLEASFYWDLKLAGESAIWNNAMASSNYDLYSAYAVEAMTDFRSIKSGLAARATFEKWFLSDRCKNFDRQIIQTMLGHYADIEIQDDTTSRMILMDVILRLGHRPIGKNYLTSIIANILQDGIYREVRDRSSANFLWFITFERRMNDLEQSVQEEDQIPSSADSGATVKANENVHYMPRLDGSSNHTSKTDEVATIFFLDHFRAG